MNQIFLSLGALGVVFVLSYFLTPETFGEMRYMAAVLAVFTFFSLPGIGTMILIEENSTLSSRGVWHAILTQIRWGLGACIGGLIAATYYQYQGNADLALAFVIASLLAPVANLYLMPGFILASVKRFKTKAIVDGSILMLVIFSTGIGAMWTQNAAGTTLFYFGMQTVVTLLFLAFVLQQLPKAQYIELTASRTDIRYGKQLTLFQIPFTLLPSIEKVLVFILLGPGALALFVIATIPLEQARSALRSLFQFYILPNLPVNKVYSIAGLRKWFVTVAGISIAVWMTLSLFILIVIPFLFPQYNQAYPIALLLSVTLLTMPLHVLVISWIALKRTKNLSIYTGLTTLIDVCLFIVFIWFFEFWGAIVAKLVVELAQSAVIFGVHSLSDTVENHNEL